jgi:hypothetical protein
MADGEKLSFRLASGMPIFLEPGGIGERVKTRYIGALSGRYIIVTLPQRIADKYIKEHLQPGNRVKIIYTVEGNMYGFQVEVICTTLTPFRQIYLKFPDFIESYNLRKFDRAECHLPALVDFAGEYIRGLIVDISAGGMRLTINLDDIGYEPEIKSGDIIDIDFTLPTQQSSSRVLTEVKNVRTVDNRMRLGLSMLEINEELEVAISDFVQELLLYRG